MSKEFNYKEELKRMFESVGGVDNCSGLECDFCPFSRQNFKGNHDRCEVEYAEEMIEIVRKWSEDHPERKIDWRKVPRDTKVLVRDDVDNEWEERYYAWYNERRKVFMCFNKGAKSYEANDTTYWSFCKLAGGVEIKEEWYE